MKRLFGFLTPIVIVGIVLFFLSEFRQVETLTPEEKAAIEQYRQALLNGTLLDSDEAQQSKAVFTQAEFEAIAKSIRDLHQFGNYLEFGEEWGYRINNKDALFAELLATVDKKAEANPGYRAFFDALREDLINARDNWDSRFSHDILHDLEDLVFTTQFKRENHHGVSKTIEVMKREGLKLIEQQGTGTAEDSNNQPTDDHPPDHPRSPAGNEGNTE